MYALDPNISGNIVRKATACIVSAFFTQVAIARKSQPRPQPTTSDTSSAAATPIMPPAGVKPNSSAAAISMTTSWIAIRTVSDRLRASSTENRLTGIDRNRAITPLDISVSNPTPELIADVIAVVTKVDGNR